MSSPMMRPADYSPALPHERIEEIFPDIFLVYGSARVGPATRLNRNMAIVRSNDELSLINPVRLSAPAESQLEKIGKVKRVLRIGYYHGVDDRYYVDRYGAEFWCQPGSDRYREPRPTHVLRDETPLPIPAAELFLFKATKFPESAILLENHGGVLITCDSLQYWTDWSYCTPAAKMVIRVNGFSLRMLIGTFWLKTMTPKGQSLRADFERLLKLEFKHLLGAHGRVCRNHAHEQVVAEVDRVFGS